MTTWVPQSVLAYYFVKKFVTLGAAHTDEFTKNKTPIKKLHICAR